jgi:hypothetical protein
MNFEWIILLNNEYDEVKLKSWMDELNEKTFYNTEDTNRKYEKLYSIWVMTTPFSESLIHTMQNLNYLGYKYKVIINDSEYIALNYIKNNTLTKYWFRFDDDFIMIENSIEYMVMIKSKVKEPVCIFQLYDLNYGYIDERLDCYIRYGIKIHDTEICKKVEYDNNVNSDLFYKKLRVYGGFINYSAKKHLHYHEQIAPNKVVGYHELFSSPFKTFCLFLKLGTKFIVYEQDVEIVWNFMLEISENRYLLIEVLKIFNKKFDLNIDNVSIEKCFDEKKMKSIIKKKSWLKKNKTWFDKMSNNDIIVEKDKIIQNLNLKKINKICGFIYGLENYYSYDSENIKIIQDKYNGFKLNIPLDKETTLICNDVNNLEDSFIHNYNMMKEKGENIVVFSRTPLISICDKINVNDLRNDRN